MRRKPRVQRTAEEKREVVLEALRSGNIAETCRRYGIAPNLYYRWKDEAQQVTTAALGGQQLLELYFDQIRRLFNAQARALERVAGLAQHAQAEAEQLRRQVYKEPPAASP